MSGIRLVVGLGNPGREYEAHRHNAGFWWTLAAANFYSAALKTEARFQGFSGRAKLDSGDLFFLLPQTFMNNSGRAVGALSRFYKIPPQEILVAHDELDLAPGDVRLKLGGSHAGHNGLKDIIASLGSPDFWRMRLGIGHPGTRDDVVNYVLNKPATAELTDINEAIAASIKELPDLTQGFLAKAQAHINGLRKSKT